MRTVEYLDRQWYFTKGAQTLPRSLPTDWEQVELPHTWNGTDGQDGGNDYFRGRGLYARSIPGTAFGEGKEPWLEFEGVNSTAEVWWNGNKLTTHHGGYSTFRVKLEDLREDNLLVVVADNAPNDFVYPQNADFTFYGGIYRPVKLIQVDGQAHFALDDWGSPGVKLSCVMEGDRAVVSLSAKVCGEEAQVRYTVLDGEQRPVQTVTGNGDAQLVLDHPHLWDGLEDPYLYTLRAEVLVGEGVVDRVELDFGCRSFSMDPQRGFILNGRAYPLRGVSRHQDWPGIGNALTPEHHKKDIELILELGANTIRLAHYQHSQTFYDLCDRVGLILWAEIPYITCHMPTGKENTLTQMRELILQNCHHPAIVTWGLSNEITAGGDPKDKTLLDNHYALQQLCKELDPTRPTTMAAVTICGMEEEIVHISDILSYNHYFGWYGGSVDMYGPWFDKFHAKYPDKAIGISEYGCEALNWHTSDPRQGDYTEEYQAYYHEELIKCIARRPWLWATHVWNMFDFAADARSEGGENGMNHKGLVTFDRQYKKDAFYAYKAWLSKEPFVHICGKRYVNRVEDVTRVTVYSNQPQVELLANGVSLGVQQRGEFPFFYFEVPNQGETALTAIAGENRDESKLCKVETPDESYILQEEGDVLNWFEITTVPGYCCINDTLGDVMATLKGKLFVLGLVKGLLGGKKEKQPQAEQKENPGMGFKLNRTVLDMAKGFSVKRIFSMVPMMGGKAPTKEEMLAINAKLNKIRKKQK